MYIVCGDVCCVGEVNVCSVERDCVCMLWIQELQQGSSDEPCPR